VIPGTLLGVLFLAACLVPGFVFLRIGERRRARLTRSPLIEAVELAGVGAAASLLSVMAVLSLGREWEFLDASALADDPGRYLLLHPFRGLGSMLGSFLLSSALAGIAAIVVFAKRQSVFDLSSSTWRQTFYEGRPNRDLEVFATIELTDGRRLAGYVDSFTVNLQENRELALRRPVIAAPDAAAQWQPMVGDFLIIRENQIATITGLYVDPAKLLESERPAVSEVDREDEAGQAGSRQA
jgi:hypothetical protein